MYYKECRNIPEGNEAHSILGCSEPRLAQASTISILKLSMVAFVVSRTVSTKIHDLKRLVTNRAITTNIATSMFCNQCCRGGSSNKSDSRKLGELFAATPFFAL